MKNKRAKQKTCTRGHKYTGSGPCPICWPGRLKKTAAKPTKYTHRHNDGTLWARGHMLGSKMHGSWVWFRKDGTKMRSGSFDKGKQVGKWVTYDKKGKVVKVTNFS